MKPRYYQRHAARKAKKALQPGVHPIIATPTGTGKSLILCMIAEDFLDDNITKDVLILSHKKKILEQDFETLKGYFPHTDIGMYSTGIGTKEIRKITVAGIQSVWRKPELFDNTGLVIIDEAHLVNTADSGMYRSFLSEIEANYVGLTATPFRLGHGYVYEGDGTLFNKLAYDLTSTENYNRLLAEGFLSNMYSYKTALNMDMKGVTKQAGDFASKALSTKFDQEEITVGACREIKVGMKKLGLKKALIFAIDTKHADHITMELKRIGLKPVCVHSGTDNNDGNITRFKKGKYNVAVSVDMLTTGLDVPAIDLVVLLRGTVSASLHVQMLGRGGRPLYKPGFDITKRKERLKAIEAGGKKRCIVMDFAGNLERLGPINNVFVKIASKKKGAKGDTIMKECPKCDMRNYGAVRICVNCGHEFEFTTRLKTELTDTIVVEEKVRKLERITEDGIWLYVDDVVYSPHFRRGKTPSMKVSYRCGSRSFSEFVCIGHTGFAKSKAILWIKYRLIKGAVPPHNLWSLLHNTNRLKTPDRILVVDRNGYDLIIGHNIVNTKLNKSKINRKTG